MKTKLLASALLAASLVGAPAVAFAQSEKAAPETKSEATMTKSHHATRTHMKHGTTTGMSSSTKARPGGRSVSRKPTSS